MKVVRTRPAPNFTLSLKIFRNLCDLRDLCVSQFPQFRRQRRRFSGQKLAQFLDGDKDTATVRSDEKTL